MSETFVKKKVEQEIIEMFNYRGREVKEVEKDDVIVAKKTDIVNGDIVKTLYEVALFNGVLFDHLSGSMSRPQRIQSLLRNKKVSKKTYDDYVTYLTTNVRKYYQIANREAMNE